MQLTPGTTITVTTTVTRQTLYDLVYNAIGGTVRASDLSATVQTIVSQSAPPTTPAPGMLWWDQTDQLLKVYTDVVEDTGCSIWLSVGPDRFDVAVLAAEPIPFGAACQFKGDGRKVVMPPDWPLLCKSTSYTCMRFEHLRVVGFQNDNNNAAHTAQTKASDSWFPMAASGIVWAWAIGGPGATRAGFGGNQDWVGLPCSFSAITCFSGYTAIRGGMVATPHTSYNNIRHSAALAQSLNQVCLRDPANQWSRVIFTVPAMGRYNTNTP